LKDLRQTSIISVEIDGAAHEFSRLPGVQEPVLDLLFKLRKAVLHAPILKLGEVSVVPFLFSGPGTFSMGDVPWPNGVQSINPEFLWVTIAPGSVLRGRFLIQKSCMWGSILRTERSHCLEKTWTPRIRLSLTQPISIYPWLGVGFPARPVERVGFRVESIGPINQQNEVLIFEIVTNGSISPRRALRESSLVLSHKFSAIANRTLPSSLIIQRKNMKSNSFKQFPCSFRVDSLESKRKVIPTFYRLFKDGLTSSCGPLSLDLGNLDLTIERNSELQNLGFKTLGQLLERLAFEVHRFSPTLKKQRQLALYRLGFFPSSV